MIIKMLLISLACLTFSEWSGIMDNLKYWFDNQHTRIKPFDCAMCLTLWVSLGVFIYTGQQLWAILYAFANSGLTVIINKIYERLSKK